MSFGRKLFTCINYNIDYVSLQSPEFTKDLVGLLWSNIIVWDALQKQQLLPTLESSVSLYGTARVLKTLTLCDCFM